MKRYISIGLALVLQVSILTTPAFSASKAGAKCSKVGSTSTTSSKTYTCIKSGKKLIWNKGVSKSAATKSTPAPALTPVEIAISIDNLDLKGVPQKAYENVEAVLKTRPRTTYTPAFFLSPRVKQERVDQEISGLNRAIDLWQPYFLPDKFQAVYVVLGDEEWLENKSREIGLSSMIPPGETWTMRMKMFYPCGFANAGKANNVPTFVQCLNADYAGGYKQTGPHEYTHLFQNSFGGQNAFTLPWYTEGSASYFGWTLGFYPKDSQFQERKSWLKTLFQNMPSQYRIDFSSKDITKFKKIMVYLEDAVNNNEIASTSYWVGGLATEVLIALYGFDKYVELTKNMQTSRDISSLLKQTYGFTADYFYEKLAPYVWAHLPK